MHSICSKNASGSGRWLLRATSWPAKRPRARMDACGCCLVCYPVKAGKPAIQYVQKRNGSPQSPIRSPYSCGLWLRHVIAITPGPRHGFRQGHESHKGYKMANPQSWLEDACRSVCLLNYPQMSASAMRQIRPECQKILCGFSRIMCCYRRCWKHTSSCAQGNWQRQLETAAVVTSWFILNITIASSTKWIFVHGNICIQDLRAKW